MTEKPSGTPAELRSWLRERLAFYLDQPPETVDPDVPLAEYGMDSVYAVSVIADIEDRLGLDIEVTAAWENPTVNLLAGYLESALEGVRASADQGR